MGRSVPPRNCLRWAVVPVADKREAQQVGCQPVEVAQINGIAGLGP